MKLTATVVWSASVEVEVADDATDEQKTDAIIDEALKAELDWKNPVIHECSDENLID